MRLNMEPKPAGLARSLGARACLGGLEVAQQIGCERLVEGRRGRPPGLRLLGRQRSARLRHDGTGGAGAAWPRVPLESSQGFFFALPIASSSDPCAVK